mmetsp:Transcript_27028/g.79872  ORF Transcript_27028/g.79872 Transcript_27028/m.79872 type:complete len:82 (-) Transcript_27028:2296-2541(-)
MGKDLVSGQDSGVRLRMLPAAQVEPFLFDILDCFENMRFHKEVFPLLSKHIVKRGPYKCWPKGHGCLVLNAPYSTPPRLFP